MWGVSHEGKVLWSYTGSTGHYPAIADVDADGQGRVLDLLPLQVAPVPGETEYWTDCYGMAADVWGDSREEAILCGSRGFAVYANARSFEQPSVYNMTLYPGR